MYIGTGGFSNSSVNSGHHQSKFAGDDPQGWDGLGWAGMGWDGLGWAGMGWDGLGILVLMWPSDSPGGVSCNLNGVELCGDVTGMMARIGMIIPKCPNFSGWWIMMCFSKNRDRIVAMWWYVVMFCWPYMALQVFHGPPWQLSSRMQSICYSWSLQSNTFAFPSPRKAGSVYLCLPIGATSAYTCQHTQNHTYIYMII